MPQNANININFQASLGNLSSVLGTVRRNFASLNQTLGQTGAALSNINQRFAGNANSINMSANSFKGLVGQVANLNRFLNATFAAVRQIGQGLQNFGTVFSIFVSTPLALIFGGIVKEMLNFDDALIEVRKTTGATKDELVELADQITYLSTVSPTARTDLAQMAADWGRMGAPVEGIAELVRVTDMLVIATTLAADEVVPAVGRIGQIFYETKEDMIRDIESIGSVINELGQKNPETESELLSAATRFAPQAKALGLSLPETFGLAATAVGTNVSAERAGTQLATAFREMAINNEKVAAASGLVTQEVKNLIDLDPVGFYLGIVDALSDIESETQKTIVAQEIFGSVGGKTALSMVANTQLAVDNIIIAKKAFDDGTSLAVEFERSMDSVKNQLKLLKNNAIAAGAAIGEVLLPYITQFAALAVPALQMATKAFEELDERTKLMTVGIGLLVTALGPFLIMIGTLMFSIGIIGTGMSTMIATLISGISHIGRFVGIIFGLIAPFKLVAIAIAAIGTAAFYIYRTLDDVGMAVGSFASNMFEWGYNILSSFADGIRSASQLVYDTVANVINSFVGLLQAFSPPKEGPLKDIDTWGENVMTAFADGMTQADVRGKVLAIVDDVRGAISGLSPEGLDLFGDIFPRIRSVITDLGSYLNDEVRADTVSGWIGRAAKELAAFLSDAESGGGSLSGLSDILGSLTGDFEQLVRAQHGYADAVERLEDIKDTLDGLDDATENQLQAVMERTDLTLDQRIALMRKIRLDASERKKQLEDEKKVAEDEKEAAKDRLDTQKQLLSVLSGLTESMPKEPKDKKDDDLTGSLPNLGTLDVTDASDELKKKLDEAKENMDSFFEKVDRGRDIMRGFFAALRGEEYSPEGLRLLGENFTAGFKAGKEIRDEITGFLDKVVAFTQPIKDLGTAIRNIFGNLGDGVIAGFLGEAGSTQDLNSAQRAFYNIGFALGFVVKMIDNFIGDMNKFFDRVEIISGDNSVEKLVDSLRNIWKSFVDAIDPDGSITEKLDGIHSAFSSIVSFLLILSGITLDNLDTLAEWIGILIGITVDQVLNLVNLAGAASALWSAFLGLNSAAGVVDILSEIDPVLGRLKEPFDLLIGSVQGAGEAIRGTVVEILIVFGFLSAGTESALLSTRDIIEQVFGKDIKEIFTDTLGSIIEDVAKTIAVLFNFADFVVRLSIMIGNGLMFLEPGNIFDKDKRTELLDSIKRQREGISEGMDRTRQILYPDQYKEMFGDSADKESMTWMLEFPDLGYSNIDEIAKEAGTKAGSELSDEFIDSFTRKFIDPLSQSKLNTAVTDAQTKLQSHSASYFIDMGESLGMDTADGLAELYGSDYVDTSVDPLLTNVEDWTGSNKGNLNKVGTTIAEFIMDGVKDGTGTSELAAILEALNAWAKDSETIRALKSIGFNIGLTLVEGMKEAIQTSGTYLSQALDNGLSGAPVYNPAPINPYGDPLANINGTVPTAQSSSAYSISVTVDAASAADRRNGAVIAKEIEKKIDRDMRYNRVSR